MEGHRFQSFADEREGNFVKWYAFAPILWEPVAHCRSFHRHIDGHDYMWAVSELLENAKECIFILASSKGTEHGSDLIFQQDWWLTPELYLRRPPSKYPEYRLDRILKRKADQGVKIHIVVYKEV